MDVKEAVQAAKGHMADLGLEEVEFDEAHGAWRVTLGFSRPWDASRSPFLALAGDPRRQRSFKVVTIANQFGKVLSLKNWTEH